MTMPGRSCVALTLLICSLESLLISEIPAGELKFAPTLLAE